MRFYGKVQDQTVNLTPNGVEDGGFLFAPRLEGWLAACELYCVPAHRRSHLIDCARSLFESMHGRGHVFGLYREPVSNLIPQPVSVLGDLIDG